jgi:rod shape-determining protein MreD
MGSALRYAMLLLTALVVQRFLLAHLRLDDCSADAFLILTVAVGMVAGTRRGAVVGFAAGLLLDLTITTPFGLGALSYLVAGTIAGSLEGLVVHSSRLLTLLVGLLASLGGLLFFVFLGAILGAVGLIDGHLPMVLLVVPVSSAFLVLPTRRVVRWAEAPSGSLNPALHR